jgi:arginase family enzyme
MPRSSPIRGRPKVHAAAATVELSGIDVAAIGIPFDTGASYRPVRRFRPEAIRSASTLLRPCHPPFGIDMIEALAIVTPR